MMADSHLKVECLPIWLADTGSTQRRREKRTVRGRWGIALRRELPTIAFIIVVFSLAPPVNADIAPRAVPRNPTKVPEAAIVARLPTRRFKPRWASAAARLIARSAKSVASDTLLWTPRGLLLCPNQPVALINQRPKFVIADLREFHAHPSIDPDVGRTIKRVRPLRNQLSLHSRTRRQPTPQHVRPRDDCWKSWRTPASA